MTALKGVEEHDRTAFPEGAQQEARPGAGRETWGNGSQGKRQAEAAQTARKGAAPAGAPKPKPDPNEKEGGRSAVISRRSLCVGAGGAAVLLAMGGLRFAGQSPAVRPPGGQDEERLMGACIRCGKCLEACPHGIIKPQHLEEGLLGFRSPFLCFDDGWCDWCADDNGGVPLCVEVCPTKALDLPEAAEPETVMLGKAVLKEDWCLAYRKTAECRWCYNACPYEAIEMDADGRPAIIPDNCNGCGACEAACISLSGGSLSADMTSRAIVVVPEQEA